MGDSELPTCVRGVYLIDPERKLQLRLTYPISVGRNFFEIIRVLDSLQITSYHQVRKGLTEGLALCVLVCMDGYNRGTAMASWTCISFLLYQ